MYYFVHVIQVNTTTFNLSYIKLLLYTTNCLFQLNTIKKTHSKETLLPMKSNSTPEHNPNTKNKSTIPIQRKSSQSTLPHVTLPVTQGKPPSLPMKQNPKGNPQTQCSLPASLSPQVVALKPSQSKKKLNSSHPLIVPPPQHQPSSNVEITKLSTKELKHQSLFFEHNHQPYDRKVLESCLTKENYKRKFHQLLCREEEEHERILQERYSSVNFHFFILFSFVDVMVTTHLLSYIIIIMEDSFGMPKTSIKSLVKFQEENLMAML